MKTTTYLASKPRYEILDGLRGVAALIVVGYHLFETYSAGPRFQILNHGYLAVDFFFGLSGFVIGYAYDDRWDRMTLGGFFKRRLTRLHPMLLLGTLIGALLFYFTGAPLFPAVEGTPWWQMVGFFFLEVLMITGLGCLFLPALPKWDIRGWGEMNSLNGASWTLFWEYVANVLYALVIRHFPRWMLASCVLLAGYLTLDVALNINLFGLLTPERTAVYTVVGGFGTSAEQTYIAAVRLAYPFLMGLLLSRCHKVIRVRGGFWWCSLLVAGLLCLPCVGPADMPWIDGAYNALLVLVLFPLIIAMGAGSRTTDRRTTALCKWLGDISYPLYITHYPWAYVQISWASAHPDAPLGTHIAVAVSLFIIAIAIAHASLKLYDEPVREWLKQHWLMKGPGK